MDKNAVLNRYRPLLVLLNGSISLSGSNIEELAAAVFNKSGMSLRRRLKNPGSMTLDEYLDLCKALEIPEEDARSVLHYRGGRRK